MIEFISYSFIHNALLAALLASITCGFIGAYVVSRRMVFISGGITHASFGGIGVGYFLGINPMVGAAIFSVLSAFGIRLISKKSDLREDSAIGILWSLGMAIGIIFIYITPGYSPNLMSYLFGSILTVTQSDILIMSILAIVTLLIFVFFYRVILYISFDEEYAHAYKIPIETFNYLMISLVSLVIVMNIRIAGIILVISFLTIPQSTANLFVNDFKKMILLSIIICFFGSCIGLALSFFWNIPSGATIIFVFVVIFALAKSFVLLRNLKLRKISMKNA